MQIERASSADIATINGVIIAAKRHWGYDDQLIGLWLKDMLVDEVVLGQRHFWLAKRDNAVVGVVSITPADGSEFQLEDCWVLPTAIGTGVGAAMVAYAAAWAKGQGASSLIIDADPHAAGFYRKLGAVQIGSRPSIPTTRTIPVFRLPL